MPRRRQPSPRSKPTRRKPSSSASSRTESSKVRVGSSNLKGERPASTVGGKTASTHYNFRVLRSCRSPRSIGAVLLALTFASPLQSADRESVRAALEQVARRIPARFPGVSIQIADEETGEVVFEREADLPQTIASVTKLITTATALHYLGPNYKFRTSFWRRGEIRQGSLIGSLLVVGGGDPNISGRFYGDDINAVFDKWAEGLRRMGIGRVVGDILLNASFFDSVGRHPDWKTDQESRWYQAPISALSYNDNVVLVSIRPGPRAGRPVGENAVKPDSFWVPIATTESDLLPTIEVCNKRSQGFYAEQIFKTVSAEKTGQATWAGSVALAKDFLASLGLDSARFQLHDGSGLSIANRAAAVDLVKFLRAMDRQPYGELWRNTLAVSGDSEGTLRHRLNDAVTRGQILAKTGSLERVSTLVGYARASSGRTYVFAILFNGRVPNGGGQALEDRLLRALVING